MRRRRGALGAGAGALGATAAVAVSTLVAGALSLLPGGISHGPPAAARVRAVQPNTSVQRVDARPAPARDVITTLLGDDPRWGATLPVPFGCPVAAPVASGQAGAVTVAVFGPGLGRTVLDQLARCGARGALSGAAAVTIKLDGGRLTAWTRGDVLVTVTTAAAPGQLAVDLDAKLVVALGARCPELAPTAADANRNPTQAGYTQFTRNLTVDIPAAAAPDTGTGPVAPPTPGPRRPALPAGLAGPPMPPAATAPVAPGWPGVQPVSAVVVVPVADPVGPGCGWSFTDAAAPDVDPGALAEATRAATGTARAALVTAQAAWLTAATSYPGALAAYTAALAGWDGYRQQVQTVTNTWTEQSARLAQFTAATRKAADQSAARALVLAAQAAAQAAYAADLARCQPAVPTDPSSVDTPTPTPTPTVGCPPVRPAVLDQPAPAAGAAPVPPVLWSAGQP